MTIEEFLTARLDEKEAAAKAATPGEWLALDGGVQSADDESQWPVAATDSARDRADRVHIASNGPARGLREVATWRAILAEAAAPADDVPRSLPGFRLALGFVLQAKAREWSDHPDWRPDGGWGRP